VLSRPTRRPCARSTHYHGHPDAEPGRLRRARTASPNEVDTAGATTAALQNLVSFQIGTAVAERDTANQIATPLTGYRISPPLALPQYPITNSVIHWDQFLYAAGSTILVETSVDNGATWQKPPTMRRCHG